MITKLNPLALNERWGGVICLKLDNARPADFDDIVAAFIDKFNNNLFFSLEVIDVPSGIYLGSCEVMDRREGQNTIIIKYSRVSGTSIIVYSYTFNIVTKEYNRYMETKPL